MDNVSIAADYYAMPKEKMRRIVNEAVKKAILKERAIQREKKTARRKQKIAFIKYTFCLGCIIGLPPILMFIHWFIFGY